MTDLPEKKDSPNGDPKQKSERPSGRWNPFASLRMPISPEERMALLKLPRPLRRPEDRLNAAELQKVAKEGRQRSLLLGLGALFGVTLFAVFGWWLWPSAEPLREPRPDAVLPQLIPTHESPLPVAAASPPATSPQTTAGHMAEPNAAAPLPTEPVGPSAPKSNSTTKPKVGRAAPKALATTPVVSVPSTPASPSTTSPPASDPFFSTAPGRPPAD